MVVVNFVAYCGGCDVWLIFKCDEFIIFMSIILMNDMEVMEMEGVGGYNEFINF